MSKTAKEITMDVLSNTSRIVDFTQMIRDQQAFVAKASRLAGSKPSKVETAYIDEQRAKLTQLEDIVKSWIWQAFEDDEDVVGNTMYWGDIQKHYNITVVVEKKK